MTWPNQITAANAGWRLQFRFAVGITGSVCSSFLLVCILAHAYGQPTD